MGYEIDKIESIKLYDRETGEEVGELHNLEAASEELSADKTNSFSVGGTIMPPRPNIRMVISRGDCCRNGYTCLCFYRPKYFNWFQRFMYKICFGITIEQGDVVRHDYL
jgi:hypothetical protein